MSLREIYVSEGENKKEKESKRGKEAPVVMNIDRIK